MASITYSSPSWRASWTLTSPTTPSAGASRRVAARTASSCRRRERRRRQDAGGVAGVHARLLDVLHDRGDVDADPVAESVDVDLDRALEEAVDEDRGSAQRLVAAGCRRARSRRACRARRARRRGGRAPGSRSARRSRAPRPALRAMPHGGTASPSSSQSVPKRSRSSARSIASKGVPRIGTPASSSARASLSGVCPPNWITTPTGCSRSQISSTSSLAERLEVEAVGRVVVGRDRLRVAVDHHGLVAELAVRPRRVHAAVVELDPLADPVGPGAEDHDRRAAVAGGSASASPQVE